MNSLEKRKQEIAKSVSVVRQIESTEGTTPNSLEAIKGELILLAAKRELFTENEFPPRNGHTGNLYALSQDDDCRFALYLNSSACKVDTPPHDHTTWAVVVGILGNELNHFYRRTDDGSESGRGVVQQINSFDILPGTGVTMMPDEIHSIHQNGPKLNLHLHMYGRALTELSERVQYDTDAGTYAVYPPTPSIIR